MPPFLEQIFAILPDGGLYYLLIGIVCFLESFAVAGLIVPGSTIAVVSGFLAFHGRGEIIPLIAVSSVASALGDLASYFLGARLGPYLMQHRVLRRYQGLIRKSELFFAEHGTKSIFFARFIGPFRPFIPFVAGWSQMRLRTFNITMIFSCILWGFAYPGLGYLFGQSWQGVETWSSRLGILIGLLLAATVIHHLMKRRLARWFAGDGTKESEEGVGDPEKEHAGEDRPAE